MDIVLTTGEFNYYATYGFTFRFCFAVLRQSRNLIGKDKSDEVIMAILKSFLYERIVFHRLLLTSCHITALQLLLHLKIIQIRFSVCPSAITLPGGRNNTFSLFPPHKSAGPVNSYYLCQEIECGC